LDMFSSVSGGVFWLDFIFFIEDSSLEDEHDDECESDGDK
jgi:hypothetical protein